MMMRASHTSIFKAFMLGENILVQMNPSNQMDIIVINTSVFTTIAPSKYGRGITEALNKAKHLFKYERIFTYSSNMTGEEDKCPLTDLINDDLYLFVRSMYEGFIKDSSFSEFVESQAAHFGEDYEQYMAVII